MGQDLRRSLITDVRLQVARTKLILMRHHANQLITVIKAKEKDIPADVKEFVERFEEVMNELENTASNLHPEAMK